MPKNGSTFDREMRNKKFARSLEKNCGEFLLSELLTDLMAEADISVRALAGKSGVAPSIIQNIRSGHRKNITYRNLISLLASMGYTLVAQKGNKRIRIA